MRRKNQNKPTIIDYLNQLDKINKDLQNIDKIVEKKTKQIFGDGWKHELEKQIDDIIIAAFKSI